MATTKMNHVLQVATGIAMVSVADVGKIAAATEWKELFYTLKDSMTITQATPTKTEVKVDQKSAAIAVTYESGDFTVEFDIPDIAQEVLTLFFTKGTTEYAPAGGKATAISLDNSIVKKMVSIKFQSGHEMIFTNAEMVANFDGSTLSTNPLNVHVTLTAKTAVGGDAGESAELIIVEPTA